MKNLALLALILSTSGILRATEATYNSAPGTTYGNSTLVSNPPVTYPNYPREVNSPYTAYGDRSSQANDYSTSYYSTEPYSPTTYPSQAGGTSIPNIFNEDTSNSSFSSPTATEPQSNKIIPELMQTWRNLKAQTPSSVSDTNKWTAAKNILINAQNLSSSDQRTLYSYFQEASGSFYDRILAAWGRLSSQNPQSSGGYSSYSTSGTTGSTNYSTTNPYSSQGTSQGSTPNTSSGYSNYPTNIPTGSNTSTATPNYGTGGAKTAPTTTTPSTTSVPGGTSLPSGRSMNSY